MQQYFKKFDCDLPKSLPIESFKLDKIRYIIEGWNTTQHRQNLDKISPQNRIEKWPKYINNRDKILQRNKNQIMIIMKKGKDLIKNIGL